MRINHIGPRWLGALRCARRVKRKLIRRRGIIRRRQSALLAVHYLFLVHFFFGGPRVVFGMPPVLIGCAQGKKTGAAAYFMRWGSLCNKVTRLVEANIRERDSSHVEIRKKKKVTCSVGCCGRLLFHQKTIQKKTQSDAVSPQWNNQKKSKAKEEEEEIEAGQKGDEGVVVVVAGRALMRLRATLFKRSGAAVGSSGRKKHKGRGEPAAQAGPPSRTWLSIRCGVESAERCGALSIISLPFQKRNWPPRCSSPPPPCCWWWPSSSLSSRPLDCLQSSKSVRLLFFLPCQLWKEIFRRRRRRRKSIRPHLSFWSSQLSSSTGGGWRYKNTGPGQFPSAINPALLDQNDDGAHTTRVWLECITTTTKSCGSLAYRLIARRHNKKKEFFFFCSRQAFYGRAAVGSREGKTHKNIRADYVGERETGVR